MKTHSPTRGWLKLLLGMLLCVAIGTPALAERVHLRAAPTFKDIGNNLEACVSLAGLGNKDIVVSVKVTGTATVTYFNPGGNEPPGQNKFPITALAWQFVPAKAIKNGNVTVCMTTPDIDPGSAPNPNWSVELDDVEFETATITVTQKGKVVLQTTIAL